MPNFVCLAELISKPGQEDALLTALQSLVKPSNEEPGCLSYALHQDVNNRQKLTMIEIFKSKEDFDFHAGQPYLLHFRTLAPDLLESVKHTYCYTLD